MRDAQLVREMRKGLALFFVLGLIVWTVTWEGLKWVALTLASGWPP